MVAAASLRGFDSAVPAYRDGCISMLNECCRCRNNMKPGDTAPVLRLFGRRFLAPLCGCLLLYSTVVYRARSRAQDKPPVRDPATLAAEMKARETSQKRSQRYAEMRSAFHDHGLSTSAITAQRLMLWQIVANGHGGALVYTGSYYTTVVFHHCSIYLALVAGALRAKPYSTGSERLAALALPLPVRRRFNSPRCSFATSLN